MSPAYYRLRRHGEAAAAIERSFAIAPPRDTNRLVLLCGLYRRARAFEGTYTCLRQALRWMRDAEQNIASKPGAR